MHSLKSSLPVWEIAISILLVTGILALEGCTIMTKVDNSPSSSGTKYVDFREHSDLNTVDIESSDLQAACAEMIGKILACPVVAGRKEPPHIIMDAEYFKIDTSSRINKHMLVDLMRSKLVSAARGRLVFVTREFSDMVQKERQAQHKGIVGPGINPPHNSPLGADYRLAGRITDLTLTNVASVEKYTQITVELIDLETGQIVFSDTYSFKKKKNISVLYR